MEARAGHQLSSDLGVIAARAQGEGNNGAQSVATLWHERRHTVPTRVIDTRYDAGHLLMGKSRRLVDVCGELGLDVGQPEIVGSMTAMHRTFLEGKDERIRERLIAMNLRHSLSTAVVAQTALGLRARTQVNINTLLFEALWDQLEYFDTEQFRTLARVGEVPPRP